MYSDFRLISSLQGRISCTGKGAEGHASGALKQETGLCLNKKYLGALFNNKQQRTIYTTNPTFLCTVQRSQTKGIGQQPHLKNSTHGTVHRALFSTQLLKVGSSQTEQLGETQLRKSQPQREGGEASLIQIWTALHIWPGVLT